MDVALGVDRELFDVERRPVEVAEVGSEKTADAQRRRAAVDDQRQAFESQGKCRCLDGWQRTGLGAGQPEDRGVGQPDRKTSVVVERNVNREGGPIRHEQLPADQRGYERALFELDLDEKGRELQEVNTNRR